jgi:uncharacterized cupredoxin-like copper-binding protein
MSKKAGRCSAALLAIIAATATSYAMAAAGPKGHAHASFSAGTPGDPKKPFRVIEMTATEGNGTMAFDPAKIVVEQGEQIKFVIKNAGELDHEFMLESFEANKKHAIEMLKNPEMEHDDPNGKRIVSRKQAEIVWKFSKLGTFEYACLIPGHYDAGMRGVVEVVAKPKSVPVAASKAKPKSQAAIEGQTTNNGTSKQ